MTTKPKQDGTMELDVGQIDLLDLPLPPPPKSGGTLEWFSFEGALRLALLVFTLQERVISFRIFRWCGGQSIRFIRRKLGLQSIGDLLRNFAFDGKVQEQAGRLKNCVRTVRGRHRIRRNGAKSCK